MKMQPAVVDQRKVTSERLQEPEGEGKEGPCHMFSLCTSHQLVQAESRSAGGMYEGSVESSSLSCDMYAGRLFLHEAPWSATSWKDPEVQELLSRKEVRIVAGPMCRWVMMSTDKRGSMLREKGNRMDDELRSPRCAIGG